MPSAYSQPGRGGRGKKEEENARSHLLRRVGERAARQGEEKGGRDSIASVTFWISQLISFAEEGEGGRTDRLSI